MANITYTPTNWIGGKTVGTADVMNNIEDGILLVYETVNEHLTNHPTGEGGTGTTVEIETATQTEIDNIFL